MQSRISRWGNSLGLRLPKALAGELGIEEGTEVELSVSKDGLLIRPLVETRYELDDLLSGVRENNRPGEVYAGPRRGREIW